MTDVPLKGKIVEIGLPKILIYLNRKRFTGTLEVRTPSFTKKVFLVQGDAIFASSSYEDDRLGVMLLKAGKISIEQYDKSIEMLKKTKKRHGAILVELGYLQPKEIFWGVKYQVREIIYSLFVLEDGEFEFIQGDALSDEVITLKMSMGNLIYDGVKRIDNWTRIRREMPAMSDILMLSNDPLSLFQDIEFGTQDKKMLTLIDGEKTIKEIIDTSWIGPFEALKILYVLYSTGILVKREGVAEKIETIAVDDLLTELSTEETSFTERVDKFMKKIQTSDDFAILEVDHNADGETIKKNYYRLAKEFHPDRQYNSEDAQIKDKLPRIFDALTLAYSNIKDHKPHVTSPEPTAQPTQSVTLRTPQFKEHAEAQEQFQVGVEALKSGDFKGAVENFQWATKFDKKNPQYWNYLALALIKLPDKLKHAEDALLEALKLEPDNADFFANLGLIYLKAGKTLRAKTQFEKALTLDPNNKKAQKALQEVAGKQ